MSCLHEQFECHCDVTRLTAGEGGPINGYTADIRIKCIECGMPFEFVGVPGGYSHRQPMCSFDATKLRAPIRPSSDPVEHAKQLLK
jgi:hypothetical protein